MNKLVRLIGVAFITISIVSVVLLGIAMVNYINVTETRTTLPEHMRISDVQIPKIEDEDEDVMVSVLFEITNPSKLTVVVTSIEASIYMDDLSDPRPFPEKMKDLLVGVAQFSRQKDDAYVINAGASLTIPVNLTLSGGTRYVSILNTTFDGKYYPFIDGTIRYTYEDINIVETVRGVILFGVPIEPYE